MKPWIYKFWRNVILIFLALNYANCNDENNDHFTSMIEEYKLKYPHHNLKESGKPQTIVTKLKIRDIIDSENIKIKALNTNKSLYRVYTNQKNGSLFEIHIIYARSSYEAYEIALERLSLTVSPLYPVKPDDLYFIGDWCVRPKYEKDVIPLPFIFTNKNIVVEIRCRNTNKEFIWDIIRKINNRINVSGEIVSDPNKIDLSYVEKHIDQPTVIKDNDGKNLEGKKILRSRNKYQYESWHKNNLAPSSEIKFMSSIFPKGNLKEMEDSSSQYRKFRLEISNGKKGVKDKVRINIWIFPTIEEAEDKFLLLLEDWNVPPSAKMENGPGRIAYSGGEEGIMFLYGNVIYTSEDKGMDHLTVAQKVAEIIKQAPELKRGEKPEIIFNK
ncbi:hypothetical protein JW926_16190 [Candidatus Sumerlaeota bacterium]|nr:hypothetical protein [Candidatus Sumerlaeota bacterium]